MRPRPLLPCIAALLALLVVAPAGADVLVTEDGGRVETRGAWEVKGRLVVFTTADGQLASLRLDEVDLEASRDATRRASQPRAEAAPKPAAGEPAKPRRKLTNADLARSEGVVSTARPGPAAAGEETDDGEAAEAPSGPAARTLVVVSSEEDATEEGWPLVRGTLANHGEEPAAGLKLVVHLLGYEGDEVVSAEAELASRALQPGEESAFEVSFPDVLSYAALRFEPSGVMLATSAPPGARQAGGEDGEDGEGAEEAGQEGEEGGPGG